MLYTVTRTNAADDTATIVGGNRYGWFTYNNINGLAIDNTELSAAPVPEPASLAVWGVLSVVGAAWGYGRRRAKVVTA